jgi:hypothetical protein
VPIELQGLMCNSLGPTSHPHGSGRKLTTMSDELDTAEKQLFAKVGEFVYYFSRVEGLLRSLLGDALKIPGPLIGPITASYDFRTLCSVALATYQYHCKHAEPSIADRFERLVRRCIALNDDRVRLVHATWSPGPSGGLSAYHMSRQSLKENSYFENLEAINLTLQKCREVVDDLVEFSWACVQSKLFARA